MAKSFFCLQQRMQESVKVPQSDFSVPAGISKRKVKTRFGEKADEIKSNVFSPSTP